MNINGKTKVCAVIGDPVEHSLSPVMHNAAFHELELNYVYVAFHVKNVKMALEGMIGFSLRGLSVTIPHKIEVMEYMDEITPLAEKIGAVNTVTLDNGKLYGTNTDGYGTLQAIETEERIDGKTVVMLGTGGAARAAAFAIACERKPERFFIAGRNEQKVRKLAQEVTQHGKKMVSGLSLEPKELKSIFRETDIIVNTTPIGMHPHEDECLLPEELFSERHVVFDMIYNPAETLLLKRAKRRFARTINGIPMFVHQGAKQFQLWTGEQAPLTVMQKAVKEALGQR